MMDNQLQCLQSHMGHAPSCWPLSLLCMLVQVRAMVEMLPKIEVVADDAFNSDPADPKNMGPEARQRHAAGETLPTAHVPTPLVGAAGRGCRLVLPKWTDCWLSRPPPALRHGFGTAAASKWFGGSIWTWNTVAGCDSSSLQAAQRHAAQVELPLGATEDRICGTIDIEKALQEGIKAYEPGLLVSVRCGCLGGGCHKRVAVRLMRRTDLTRQAYPLSALHDAPRPCPQAKANRGILYVDEVNLLDDGLVDVVLDSAASGVNTVEREGISIAHPARVTARAELGGE